MTPDVFRLQAQRASRGNQLAAAFLLAFLRGDSPALASLLEDIDGDVMPFAVGMASHARVLAQQLDGLDVWQRYLTVTAATSADLALDPDAAGRITRGEI